MLSTGAEAMFYPSCYSDAKILVSLHLYVSKVYILIDIKLGISKLFSWRDSYSNSGGLMQLIYEKGGGLGG